MTPYSIRSGVRFCIDAVTAMLVFGVVAIGCKGGGSSTPSAPSAITVNGTWSGTASDSSGPGTMTWQLSQMGTTFSGTLTMKDSTVNVTGRGSVSGTLSGSSLQFSMSVPA